MEFTRRIQYEIDELIYLTVVALKVERANLWNKEF